MKKQIVLIRFNTNYPNKSDKKWRIIVDSVQHLVDEFMVTSKSFSSEDIVSDDKGGTIVKYHVTTHAKSVSFVTSKGLLKAIIK